MSKTKARRFAASSRTQTVGKILKIVGLTTFSIVWLYAFIKVYGAILIYLA